MQFIALTSHNVENLLSDINLRFLLENTVAAATFAMRKATATASTVASRNSCCVVTPSKIFLKLNSNLSLR